MIRFLNLIALIAVIGSGTWAYSVKYETILVAEKLKKRQTELRKERDAIAVLEAEWQLLNRPARLALLAKPEEGMGPISARQVAMPNQIPAPVAGKQDALDTLLTGALPATPLPKTTTATPLPKVSGATPVPKSGAAKSATKAAPAKVANVSDKAKAQPGKTAPLALTPAMSGAPKAQAPKTQASKTAAATPKAKGTAAPVPLAPVGPPPARSEGGIGALFKKILN